MNPPILLPPLVFASIIRRWEKEGNWCCRFGVFVVVLPWNLLQIASAGRFLGICRPFRSNHLRNLLLPLADASMIYWSSLVDGGGIVIVASVFCVCFCRIEILLRPMNLLVVWLSFDLLTPNLSLPQAEDKTYNNQSYQCLVLCGWDLKCCTAFPARHTEREVDGTIVMLARDGSTSPMWQPAPNKKSQQQFDW